MEPARRRSAERDAATLRQHLATGMTSYDYVLIDCPPSLGQLTRTALASSTEVIMPIQCEYFAMEGLAQMRRDWTSKTTCHRIRHCARE